MHGKEQAGGARSKEQAFEKSATVVGDIDRKWRTYYSCMYTYELSMEVSASRAKCSASVRRVCPLDADAPVNGCFIGSTSLALVKH